jgi:hypothetical protein
MNLEIMLAMATLSITSHTRLCNTSLRLKAGNF